MSIRPITVKSANSGAFGAESPDFIVVEAKDRDTYIPPIEFATASNFVRFGSAKEYYAESIKRIYAQYPYDGSQKEKTQFHLSSSYLDRWIFNTKYPKHSGYAQFDGSSYIQVNRGYQEATTPASTKLSKLFDSKKVVHDTAKRRKQTVFFDFDDGVTWEWRMKVDGYNSSFSGSHLYQFSCDTGRIDIMLMNHNSIGPSVPVDGLNVFHINMSSSAGRFGKIISNDAAVTTSSVADGLWHHYGISLYREGSNILCDFYFDGQINKRTGVVASTFPNLTGSVTCFIMSGSLDYERQQLYRWWRYFNRIWRVNYVFR